LPSAAFFCRYRNLVARCFGKRKNARGSSTRYNKRSDNFLAAITLFCTHLRITAHEPAASHCGLRLIAVRIWAMARAAGERGAKAPTGFLLPAHSSTALASGIEGQMGFATLRACSCKARRRSRLDKAGKIGERL
jgi:hypothetical protein